MASKTVTIIGGGAAGYFASIQAARLQPQNQVILLEATKRPLLKVKISGGGRCNLTHNCFDPRELVQNYPRGSKELLGPFSRFQPSDTIDWFARHGVETKVEPDGRMFPTSNQSSSVVTCLQDQAKAAGVDVRLGHVVSDVSRTNEQFTISIKNQAPLTSDHVMLATGSVTAGHEMARSLGHTVVSPNPSIFTFNVKSPLIDSLQGISFPRARVALTVNGPAKTKYEHQGPVLITHWGLSGPCILRLSAFAARDLAAAGYQATIRISWLGRVDQDELSRRVNQLRANQPREQILETKFDELPKRFWQQLLAHVGIQKGDTWGQLPKAKQERLVTSLVRAELTVDGRSVFKEEFVTAGGVERSEIDWRRMESKVQKGLFFGGEAIDIDGVTGGFNFQAAWTTGWIAGSHLGS